MKTAPEVTIVQWVERAHHRNTWGYIIGLWFIGAPVVVGMWFLLDSMFSEASFFAIVGFIWVLLVSMGWFVYSAMRTFDRLFDL